MNPGTRVAYVPGHAHGNVNHPDVERGTVSGSTAQFIFVTFDEELEKYGREAASKACSASNLILI